MDCEFKRRPKEVATLFKRGLIYRSELGQWKITDSAREQYEQRKKAITQQIYEKFDDPENPKRRSGVLCQRSFAKPAELSNLLGINEELIVRFHNIAIAFNVDDPINPYRLDNYCKETYRHYLNLYPWCQIPTAIHQVLAHGAEVYLHAPPPLGYLAEEMADPLEIELKRRHTHHARPRSIRENLKDVFFRAMYASDPVISSCWIQRRRKSRCEQNYPRAVMDMLVYEDEGSDSEDEGSNPEDKSSDPEDEDEIPMKMLEFDVREVGLRFRKFDD